ncbi:Ppx/GppA phosphatase [Ammonifex degensii KC4]|uniref:Ppx/GppA phosphatase n=1 Tax=Ammonifex degensii (strain DSM 10501 / KC4) TaxID=429009 RepID=C9RA11_AMMDK|nr:Ppx/GppA phosphatase [Ammonifex degensii]ACX53140.1 Ppx/GppA phosphatase [Ammonifex degensii KC4]
MRVAVIDVGTNSTRYLLAEVACGKVDLLEADLKITRLGEEMTSGRLGERAMARTLAAVVAFWRRAEVAGAEVIAPVATSAVREAANREEFCRLFRQATKLELRVLSGEEEAFYTFHGVLTGMPSLSPRNALVMDLGGGSTEFIWQEHKKLKLSSLPLGAVRLTLEAREEEYLEKAKEKLAPLLSRLGRKELVATGGTVTTLAAIAGGVKEYYPGCVHGRRLTAAQAKELYTYLQELSLEERRQVPGLAPERADIIVAGTAIVVAVLELTRLPFLTVSEHDLLWGVALAAAGCVEGAGREPNLI